MLIVKTKVPKSWIKRKLEVYISCDTNLCLLYWHSDGGKPVDLRCRYLTEHYGCNICDLFGRVVTDFKRIDECKAQEKIV